MVNTYSAAVQCERVRESVFAGTATPHVFGPPTDWIAQLAQALQLDAQGQTGQAAAARAAALDAAPATRGRLNDVEFEWVADADSRLGPTLEVVINGRYGWLPFEHVSQLAIEPVVDLRDLVWAPAQLTFANGAGTVCLLPVRYVGTAAQSDGALQLARRTEWLEMGDGQYRGLGQRVIATDAAEIGLLEVKSLSIDTSAAA
jgi:type VI secretion system protein ImpE